MEGSDKDFLAGFFVMSINEWKVSQPRVLILTRSAYYRVTYNPKNGKIDHNPYPYRYPHRHPQP